MGPGLQTGIQKDFYLGSEYRVVGCVFAVADIAAVGILVILLMVLLLTRSFAIAIAAAAGPVFVAVVVCVAVVTQLGSSAPRAANCTLPAQ